jgi:FAD/FMN-containing dehydrogenase
MRMSIDLVSRSDERFQALAHGKNPRFPETPAGGANSIALCHSASDVVEAVERFVHGGLRPTVRSGGHCYEGFVYSNPGGGVVDLRAMTAISPLPGKPGFLVEAGSQLGQIYKDLHAQANVTIPGGTCVSVGAGGHISGGGYGLLSRKYGLTCDWVSAVDIVTVDKKGKATLRHVDSAHDADLFRACRGAGGGSFGVITGFYFDKLPAAPKEVMSGRVNFDWATMTEERFVRILSLYGNYWETRGMDEDTWGLFTIFNLSHRSSGHLGMSVQFCDRDGTCNDTKVLEEFFAMFDECRPVAHATQSPVHDHLPASADSGQEVCMAKHTATRRAWIDSVAGSVGAENRRKHKSAYMKRGFTPEQARCIYKYLTSSVDKLDLSKATILVDSFGGAVNQPGHEGTAIAQRSSVMKLQFIGTWSDPAQDAPQQKWLDDFYTDVYASGTSEQHKGTPYPGDRYEGCYINYPDVDMLRYKYWPQLYYGTGALYPALQKVKRHYDANNVFHHALSIRT